MEERKEYIATCSQCQQKRAWAPLVCGHHLCRDCVSSEGSFIFCSYCGREPLPLDKSVQEAEVAIRIPDRGLQCYFMVRLRILEDMLALYFTNQSPPCQCHPDTTPAYLYWEGYLYHVIPSEKVDRPSLPCLFYPGTSLFPCLQSSLDWIFLPKQMEDMIGPDL